MTEKGYCEHGEFDLEKGCPQCIAEREAKEGNTEESIAQAVEAVNQTAVVKIAPDKDEAVIALFEQSLRLEQYATALVVTNDDKVKSATNDLSIISGLKKAIEEKRKEYTQPIREHLDTVNEAFKALVEPLNNADQVTRRKILDYRAEQERQRQEAEDIARVERETAERKAALTGEKVVIPETAVPPTAPNHYRAEMGTLGKATIWKWEVVDFSLLPDRFKMENATLIGKVVRAGEREIPGVRIWAEDTLRVTAKKGDET